MITGARPGGNPHPVLTERAGQTDLTGGGCYLRVLVVQLLLDEGPGIDRVPHPLVLQLLQEILVSETLHYVDGHGVGNIRDRGPADGQTVVQLTGGVAQFDEVSDVQRNWGPSGFCPRLTREGVGEGHHLPIDFNTETLGEVIRLFAGGVQQRESQLHLLSVLNPSGAPRQPRVAHQPGLGGAEVEDEGLILQLHLPARIDSAGLQTGGSEENVTEDVERQSLEDNIGVQGVDWCLLERNNWVPDYTSAH